MKKIPRIFKDMKYRYKLTLLLVVSSIVPVILLAGYNHRHMGRVLEESELEDMTSILEQAKDSIDSQVEVYSNLINYLTYSPDIEELIEDTGLDTYAAYERYTQVIDPLLTVPKSYHPAIRQIQLYADSIEVRHAYTLIPLAEFYLEWWSALLEDSVQVQWLVNREKGELAAIRRIERNHELQAILCITLDYDEIFQPVKNVVTNQTGAVVTDSQQQLLFFGSSAENGVEESGDTLTRILEKQDDRYACVSTVGREVDWNYYLYMPQDVIASAISQMLVGEMILIFVCMVLVVVLGALSSKLITRDVEQLTRNMEQVNHGSRVVTVNSDSKDEIGVLIRTFRNMMDEINRLIHEVYENRISRKELELKALTAQINPHFLYNSLSVINWMAIRSKQMEISRVTLALSRFYRTALSKGQDLVTVESCIENIEAYLQIQLVMHDNDFRVEWDVDEQVKGEILPKLIVQPIVENALEHGLDEKEEGEKILHLSFRAEKDGIRIRVEDNGPGMEQETAERLVSYQAKGYGLKNVNDRLRLVYGEECNLKIFSELGKGTRVEMYIPGKQKQQEGQQVCDTE